jgi:hypothetical protein
MIQVQATPQVVVFEDTTLTAAQLNAKANQLARSPDSYRPHKTRIDSTTR